MSNHTVTLIPSGERRQFPAGTLLSDALLDMGMPLKTPCGGKGTCGTCRVSMGPKHEDVLACKTHITGDLTVHELQPSGDYWFNIPDIKAAERISLAVDIGTTTVRIALVDPVRKETFEITSFLNPQRRFGHDVISRIASARVEANRLSLQTLIRKAIASRIEHALRAMDISHERVDKVVFSGNTAMLYLLYGIDVSPLGAFPYVAETRDFPELDGEGLGLGPLGSAKAQALPVLGAFTGADLVGGLSLCHEMGIRRNAFFIDLGTNGELFVLDGEGTPFAASCAMGPALEGMNISWGMTAETGALTRVHAGPRGLEYHMLGEGEPAGITGTALIDLAAIMLRMGLMSPKGTFTIGPDESALPAPLELVTDHGAKALNLWGRLSLSQKDIRNLQLAKGASLAASLLLLDAAGCRPFEVEHVFIAGAFGEHLDLENFTRLGFIPDFGNARKEFLGNTSLKAAARACLDPGFMGRAAALRDSASEIVLSAMPGFQDTFIKSLEFTS